MFYIISYDLNKAGQLYGDLENKIKFISTGKCIKILETVWIVKSQLPSSGIYSSLLSCLDANDLITIAEINLDNTYANLAQATHDTITSWL